VGASRLHGTFLQTKAETGRLAMDEPSLHNIPHARHFRLAAAPRRQHTLALRSAFAPAAGRVLLLADYRQFELRMMLHFAGDADLTARLVGPEAKCDPFKGLAALWCRKAVDAVTEDERAWAKTVSYGLLYGKAVSTMAFDLDIDVAQAQIMVDAFKESLPAVGAWLKRCVEESREQHMPGVTTIAGRRRMLPDLVAVRLYCCDAGAGWRADACECKQTGDNWRARGAAERQAVNTVCQARSMPRALPVVISLMRVLTSCDDAANRGRLRM
jgi:DNA polymerase-1